jgi:hypothetical protein
MRVNAEGEHPDGGAVIPATSVFAPMSVPPWTTREPKNRAAVEPEAASDFDEHFVPRISGLTITKHLNGVARERDLPGGNPLGPPLAPAQARVAQTHSTSGFGIVAHFRYNQYRNQGVAHRSGVWRTLHSMSLDSTYACIRWRAESCNRRMSLATGILR